jgi:hypothetical protein
MIQIDPEVDTFLFDHVVDASPLLPTVMQLDLVARGLLARRQIGEWSGQPGFDCAISGWDRLCGSACPALHSWNCGARRPLPLSRGMPSCAASCAARSMTHRI